MLPLFENKLLTKHPMSSFLVGIVNLVSIRSRDGAVVYVGNLLFKLYWVVSERTSF